MVWWLCDMSGPACSQWRDFPPFCVIAFGKPRLTEAPTRLRSVSKSLQRFCKISYLSYMTVAERLQTVSILNAALITEWAEGFWMAVIDNNNIYSFEKYEQSQVRKMCCSRIYKIICSRIFSQPMSAEWRRDQLQRHSSSWIFNEQTSWSYGEHAETVSRHA